MIMVNIARLSDRQKLHVLGSDRYSIRNTEVFDEVMGRYVNIDEIGEE